MVSAPVFVDVEIETYNILTSELEKALSEKIKKAIMIAYTLALLISILLLVLLKLGNLYVIEDCCDAVGSLYRGKQVGTFGHLATVSFYPAHHMTMGEGGAVLTNDDNLMQIAPHLGSMRLLLQSLDQIIPVVVDSKCNMGVTNWI